jgi:tetratricopeptide (TPR) repeat protein
LESELEFLYRETEQYDEALRLIDRKIEQKPDDVRAPISRASIYHYCLDDLEAALIWIDVALERAFRTRFSRREALANKARLLLELRRGEELGQVLEQIMSLDMYRGVPDIGKERDFVDRAPPGLIPEDIVGRYNRFFQKHDRALELHRWADHARLGIPI